MTRFRYRFHGLTLGSNRLLPGLTGASAASIDTALEVSPPGEMPLRELPWVMTDPPRTAWRARTPQGSFLRLTYEGVDAGAEFVIDAHGEKVWASWTDGVAIQEAAELFLGPVWSCVLGQRGLTCLHAGVVEIEGRVIALAGGSGAGKSTTTLALVQRGGSLVADDVGVLGELDGAPAVLAGEPRVRMRPDSAAALCGSFDALRPMWIHEELRPLKRYVDLPRAAAGLVGLDAVYLLAPRGPAGSEPAVRPVSGLEALPRLMADRHMARVLEREGHRRDFERLARLVERVPIRELSRPEGLQATERTVDVLLADVRALA